MYAIGLFCIAVSILFILYIVSTGKTEQKVIITTFLMGLSGILLVLMHIISNLFGK